MADLFDMNVGGLGFHLTSHVIAIAALFIACFAIAGYITFRDDSIKRSALKDDAAAVELPGPYEIREYVGYTSNDFKTQAIAAVSNIMTSRGVASSATGALILPKGSRLFSSTLEVLTAVTGVTDIDLGVHATSANSDDSLFDALALASIDTVGEKAFANNSAAETFQIQADNYVTVTANTSAVTAGELKVTILAIVPV